MSDLTPFPLRLLVLACLAVLAGCVAPPQAPAALDFKRSSDARLLSDLDEQRIQSPTKTVIGQNPKPPALIEGNLRPITPKVMPSEEAGNLSVSFDQISVPAFIQAVYGGILKINYSVDPAVAARTELITFRTPKPMSAARLAEVSGALLRSYGVAVQDFGGVLRMVLDTNTASTLPMVRRGRAQPTVPLPLRPIFHYVETEAVRPQAFLQTLKTILGTKVTVETDAAGTGLLVSGQPDDVGVALELIQVFDQPGMRAQNTTRVVPRYWGADEFSKRLSEVLRLEGYSVGNAPGGGEPIVVYSITPINTVLILGGTREIMAHALDWVRELDQLPTVQAGNAYFTYPVKNADAQELAKALNDLISGISSPATGVSTAGAGLGSNLPTNPSVGGAAAPASSGGARGGKRVVVNNATNSLIFQGGTQEDYRQWLSLLAQLDKPVKSALIDVLVAEVALADNNDLGFVWKIDQLGTAAASRVGGLTYSGQTSGSGVTLSALTGTNLLRQVAINALASNSDARVVSNPKVLTRNGESATISVGQDVPIVTSQAVTQSASLIGGGNGAVVPQTVQYRNTGVILRVRPVIHAGDRIDIEISQEVSSAEPTTTGVTTSPTIRRRSVETKLSLRDGATVMLGGLISDNTTNSDSGVPLLKDIPGLGALFKSQSRAKGRTELVMLITPYILNDSTDAEAATDAYNNSLGDWADSVRSRVNAARTARNKRIADEQGANGSMPDGGGRAGLEPAATTVRPLPGKLAASVPLSSPPPQPPVAPVSPVAPLPPPPPLINSAVTRPSTASVPPAAAAEGLGAAAAPNAAPADGLAAGTAPPARSPNAQPDLAASPLSNTAPAVPAAVAPAPPMQSASPVQSAEAAEPADVPVSAPARRPRMINLSNATGSPEAAGASSDAGGQGGAPADGGNAALVPIPTGRKEAPPVIEGYKVPQGATVVDDAKLKQEIMDQLRRR